MDTVRRIHTRDNRNDAAGAGEVHASATNLQSMVFQLPEFGLFALAMTVTILTGGINLSGYYLGNDGRYSRRKGHVCPYESGADVGAAILTAIVIAMISSSLCGMLNGYIVAYIGAPAMMATLGTSTLFEGIGLLVSMGNSISGFPTEFFWFGNGTVLGIPVP